MTRFVSAIPVSLVVSVTLAGCALDPSAPHPLVARATTASTPSAPTKDGVLTVPTAVILREGHPVVASADATETPPSPPAPVALPPETEDPSLTEIKPNDLPQKPAEALPLQQPFQSATIRTVPIIQPPVVPVTSITPVLEDIAPEYVGFIPEIPADPLPPVPQSASQFPVQVPYGASF